VTATIGLNPLLGGSAIPGTSRALTVDSPLMLRPPGISITPPHFQCAGGNEYE